MCSSMRTSPSRGGVSLPNAPLSLAGCGALRPAFSQGCNSSKSCITSSSGPFLPICGPIFLNAMAGSPNAVSPMAQRLGNVALTETWQPGENGRFFGPRRRAPLPSPHRIDTPAADGAAHR